jgi:hypothetical protein
MSKEIEKAIDGITKGGIITKIMVFSIITFLCLFSWNVFQGNVVLKELVEGNKNIEKLINEQTGIKIFRKCVKKEYDNTMNEFNNELLMILGKTLNDNNISFPQELNESIRDFREKAKKINDCLIFPEELE